MASSGDIVLSYHNSVLRESDVSLLEGPKWLNDQLIAFTFEYFEFDLFKDHSEDVAFISPEVVQVIKFAEGAELGLFLEPLELTQKQLVFLAINDSSATTSVSGSHWSLLMYSRSENSFQHYDSSGSYNKSVAQQVAKKMNPFLSVGRSEATFSQETSPQQQNGYDCGLFVICNSEHLCKQRLLGSGTALSDSVSQSVVTGKRQELKTLISTLKAGKH